MKEQSNINTGAGNDTVTIGHDMKNQAQINTGEGDDIINLGNEMKDQTSIDGGTGFDILDLCEWYCDEHKDLFVYFDSWDYLKLIIDNLDYENKVNRSGRT